MNHRLLPILAAVVALLMAGCATTLRTEAPAVPAHLADSVSYRRMADGLHAVLRAANEAFLKEMKNPAHPSSPEASPVSPDPNETPGARLSDAAASHAEFLSRASLQIATGGAEFSFALRSPWPTRPLAAAQTQVEEEALVKLQQQPDEPVFRDEQLGGRAYFTAIYPERATSAACADCHNQLPASPRRDFQTGDLIGALVIRIPREF